MQRREDEEKKAYWWCELANNQCQIFEIKMFKMKQKMLCFICCVEFISFLFERLNV